MNSATPAFGTYEWARRTANCVEGCFHDCLYCYAKAMAIRFGRRSADDWRNEVPKIKWKESIKKVIGIQVPKQAGLDV